MSGIVLSGFDVSFVIYILSFCCVLLAFDIIIFCVKKELLLPPHYSIFCPMIEFVLNLQVVVLSDLSSLIGFKTF